MSKRRRTKSAEAVIGWDSTCIEKGPRANHAGWIHGPSKLLRAREFLLLFLGSVLLGRGLLCWGFLSGGFLYVGLFNGFFFSLLGSCCAGCAGCFSGHGLFQNQRNLGHWSVVAGAVVQLDRAGVATCTAFKLRRQIVEEVSYYILVWDELQHCATVSQGSTLSLGDDLFSVWTKDFGLRIGGLDCAVLEQASCQVAQHVRLLLSGAAETGTLLRGRHLSTPRVRIR